MGVALSVRGVQKARAAAQPQGPVGLTRSSIVAPQIERHSRDRNVRIVKKWRMENGEWRIFGLRSAECGVRSANRGLDGESFDCGERSANYSRVSALRTLHHSRLSASSLLHASLRPDISTPLTHHQTNVSVADSDRQTWKKRPPIGQPPCFQNKVDVIDLREKHPRPTGQIGRHEHLSP